MVQRLSASGTGLNVLDDVHPAGHPAEGRESLPVGIPPSVEIRFRMIADPDEKFGGGDHFDLDCRQPPQKLMTRGRTVRSKSS